MKGGSRDEKVEHGYTEWTLVTVPDAGQFVQHDAAATVTHTMLTWLANSERH